jgi:hypothetical protein
MESEGRGRKRNAAQPDRLGWALARVTVLAPGGFVAGYLAGLMFGRLLGACGEATPVLLAIPAAILGMGAGSTLAAVRVRRWGEGVVVWLGGIVAMTGLVTAIGLLGVDSLIGRALAVGWLVAAAGLAIASIR